MLEVAHEALFRSWSRLRAWLDEDREQLLWQQRMRASVDEWQRAGRDSGALLRGGRLSEARRWLDLATGLPDDIRTYVEASREQEAAERAQTDRRRRRTLGRTDRRIGRGAAARGIRRDAVVACGGAATHRGCPNERRSRAAARGAIAGARGKS